ncbi:MAG: CHAT domain-containing protein [Chloroflexaceae bacterium]|nr:CHAT domain-containing protein [Chloroflexaceae bacterium]
MNQCQRHDPSHLARDLLQCPAEQRRAWVAALWPAPGLELIEELKAISDATLFTDPAESHAAFSCALLVAEQMPDEPLALPLARWARGTWETFHSNPQEAIGLYELALPVLRAHGEPLHVARLLGNMISSYTDTADHHDEADCAYAEAREIFLAEMHHPARRKQAKDGLQMLEENYGWMLHERGRYEEALEVHHRALELAHQLALPVIIVEVKNNLIMTLVLLGRLSMEEAEQQLRDLRAIVEAHHQVVTVARIDMNLGEIASALGEPVKALHQLHIAEEQFTDLKSAVDIGTVRLFEAKLFERIGALPAAIRCYAQAQRWFRERMMSASEGNALFLGAVANRRYGEYERALTLLEESDARWHKTGNDEWITRVWIEQVELALDWQDAPISAATLLQTPPPRPRMDLPELKSRYHLVQAEARVRELETMRKQGRGCPADALDQARHLCEQALHTTRQFHDPWLERRALLLVGRISLVAGEYLQAHHYLEATAACDDRIRRMLSEAELKASFQQHTGDVFPLLVRFAATHQHPAQTLHTVWRAKGSALLDLLAEARVRRDSAQEAPAARTTLLQEIALVRQQLASYRLRQEQERKRHPMTSTSEPLKQKIDELEQRLYDLRRQRIRHTAPETAAILERASPLSPGHFAAWEGEVLIEYMRCDNDLLAVRYDYNHNHDRDQDDGHDIHGGNCRAVWLDLVSLHQSLRKLQRVFANVALYPNLRQQNHAAWLNECLPALRQCYDTLIAPLGPLPANARLLIAPCEPLYAVPFAALWDGQHYLVEHHEIEMTPCGALLLVPPVTAPPAPPLVIANSNDGWFPENRAQAATIQQFFPTSTCLVDDRSDYAQLSGLASAPVVLHIAAHNVERDEGNTPAPAPIFTALQLAGGLLTVEQCFDLPLVGTELVTLGGCTTGGGLNTGGSLLAFQSACFLAGARRVVASLWAVHERDAHLWMAHFYRYLHEYTQTPGTWLPATAVRQTQLSLLRDPQTSHPAVWANFACSRR